MKLKTKDFISTLAALAFIDELKEKNKKCEGHLTCSSNEVIIANGFENWPKHREPVKTEVMYTWHVTYDADLLKGK